MARATRHTGASYTEHELSDPNLPEVIIRRAEIGYVDRPKQEEEVEEEAEPSPGSSSSASMENENPSDEPSKPNPRRHARTTGSHSSQPEKETGDDVHSTGTAGRKTANRARATVVSADDEFDDFD